MNELLKYKHHVKVVVSTKQALVEQRVNEILEELENDGYEIFDIDMNISYCGREGYQILACIKYMEEVKDELKDLDLSTIGFDFGVDPPDADIVP